MLRVDCDTCAGTINEGDSVYCVTCNDDQQRTIEDQIGRIEDLENQVEALEKRVEELATELEDANAETF